MNRLTKAIVLGISVLAFTATSHAVLLGLTKTEPDFLSSYVGLYYNATSNTMTVVGGVPTLQLVDLSLKTVTTGLFSMTLSIDDSGYASSGSFSFTGTVADLGYSGTLLTGSLAPGQFGYDGSNQYVFEFVFNVTGGAAAAIWGPQAGMSLNTVTASGFTGSFLSDFGNVANAGYYGPGVADTYSIPEPASIALFVIGSALLISRKRTCVR